MVALNMFRSKRHKVCCAVPEDQVVPSFVDGGRWVYDRKLDGDATSPIGFNRSAAEAAARFNGFYLFELFERSSRTVP
jgi:hypothetical protein